jgi:hypothetical protein
MIYFLKHFTKKNLKWTDIFDIDDLSDDKKQKRTIKIKESVIY